MFLISPFGRIGRGKWWLGQLANILLLIFGIVAIVWVNAPADSKKMTSEIAWSAFGSMLLLLAAMIWINVCTTITRYHDRGKSGVWFLITFIPLIGWIWQWIECGCLPGEQSDNEYGDGTGGGFDIADEIEAMANQGQPKPAMKLKPSFVLTQSSAQPAHSFGQAPKPMFGSR